MILKHLFFYQLEIKEMLYLNRVRHVCMLRDHVCGRQSCAVLTFCLLRKGYLNDINRRRTFVVFFCEAI